MANFLKISPIRFYIFYSGILTNPFLVASGYDFSDNNLTTTDEQVDFYQKYIESLKFGYAQRGLLGDPDFVPIENISSVCQTNFFKFNSKFKPLCYQ